MSRTLPPVLAEHYDKKTHKTHQVLEAEALYVVMYDGKPFNSKRLTSILNDPMPSYQRTTFPYVGNALRLASRLNARYKTDKFTVYKMTGFEPVKQ